MTSPPGRAIGTARVVLAWVLGLLTLLCVALAVITLKANGLLVLATVFAVATAWALGAFGRTSGSA